MAKITFVILAHENARHVADLARLLTGWDEHAQAVIHYDLKSPAAEFAKLKAEFANSDRIHLVSDRIRCGWGDFSLVDAVVRALRLIRKQKLDCERVMLISGACLPIRPLREFSAFLDAHPETEFIEAFDSDWMVGGLRKERYQYWHLFNHQTQHTLFNYHYKLQRKIWPKRRFPRGLEPRFGSQWWCLRWELCEKILDYIRKHPMIYFFFSTTWIPDEMFFQTMAFHFTPIHNLARRTLTFFHFNDWGKPLVFLDDHRDLLRGVPFFFARKIGSRAQRLRTELIDTAQAPAPEKPLEIDLSDRYVFPYKQMLRELPQADRQCAPALFQYRPENGWDEILDKSARNFVILYGPPQLTRRAADALSWRNELTVFGRLFNPDWVDFGGNRNSFEGLRSDDHKIRDMDPPYYFGRILRRCETMMVFELCPGDNPDVEIALLQSENAIVLPIVPGEGDDVVQQLYWILCSRPDAATNRGDSPTATYRSMLKAVDRVASKEYRGRIETMFKNARATQQNARDRWRAALEFQHGKAVNTIVDAYDDMLHAVRNATIVDMMQGMPDNWKEAVKTFARYDPPWEILRISLPIVLPDPSAAVMQLRAALALGELEEVESP